MNERPIIFSGPMVRAILAGLKTQTRRVITFQPEPDRSFRLIDGRLWTSLGKQQYDPRTKKTIYGGECRHEEDCQFYSPIVIGKGPNGDGNPARSPYGQPGDRLWVRETWTLLRDNHWHDCGKSRDAIVPDHLGRPRRNAVAYAADSTGDESERCRRELGYKWKSTIHMPRWASRITLEITAVRVERLQDISEADAGAEGVQRPGFPDAMTNRGAFAKRWDESNGKGSWEANPWVWAIEFRKVDDR